MLLAGQLSRSSLGDILGQLLRARATGVLVLEETAGARAGLSHAVHVVSGQPRAVASDGPRLGELLSARGELDPAKLAQAVRRKRAGDDRLIGELLCDLGSDAEAIEHMMERQTIARLDGLFDLRDARVRFHTALFDDVAPRAWVRASRVARGISASQFLHGRPRARARVRSLEDERRDAFRVLGIEPTNDREQLRVAFKRRVVELHPDRASDEEERLDKTRALARVTAAYQRLTG